MHPYIWIHQESEAVKTGKFQTHLNNFEDSETKNSMRWRNKIMKEICTTLGTRSFAIQFIH
jgi:hypothetical protein